MITTVKDLIVLLGMLKGGNLDWHERHLDEFDHHGYVIFVVYAQDKDLLHKIFDLIDWRLHAMLFEPINGDCFTINILMGRY
jgi:hypothetical protein